MFRLQEVKYKDILYVKNLFIPKGKITAIVGESGSGKTTLLRLLNKLISPTCGKIFYNEKPLDEINSIELRRNVVMLPQAPPIFAGTVRDNLLIGLKFSEKPIVGDNKLLETLNMVHLNKPLTEDAEKLSGGEKQRLALGRIILMDPEVFLLDEPSSALDEDTEKVIIEKLVQYTKAKDKTLIMVTHSRKVSEVFSDIIIEIKKRNGCRLRREMKMKGVIELQIWQIAAAYIFVVILLAIVRIKGIPREKEIIISTVRMTLQLILTGYVLVYIFDHSNPLYTIIITGIMEIFAIYNIYKRTKTKLAPKIKRIIAFSMICGTLSSLMYFILVVINLSPWYEPRYFNPIAGMIIGNSMTGISLGVARLVDGMTEQKNLIESALMLGATPKMAAKQIVDSAFDSAILPTVNSMVGMGIVFLPGMMTGQILSGTSPVTAIEYQIAIMLGILGSVTLTVILFVHLGYKAFFNKEQQLEI